MRETEILRGLGAMRQKQAQTTTFRPPIAGREGLRAGLGIDEGPTHPSAPPQSLRDGAASLLGPGTGTSDSIHGISLSHGEAVLPAKTVQKVGPQNIARLIADTTGKAPQQGLRAGGHYADGSVLDGAWNTVKGVASDGLKAAKGVGTYMADKWNGGAPDAPPAGDAAPDAPPAGTAAPGAAPDAPPAGTAAPGAAQEGNALYRAGKGLGDVGLKAVKSLGKWSLAPAIYTVKDLADHGDFYRAALPESMGGSKDVSGWEGMKQGGRDLTHIAVDSAGAYAGGSLFAGVGSVAGPLGALAGGIAGAGVGGHYANELTNLFQAEKSDALNAYQAKQRDTQQQQTPVPTGAPGANAPADGTPPKLSFGDQARADMNALGNDYNGSTNVASDPGGAGLRRDQLSNAELVQNPDTRFKIDLGMPAGQQTSRIYKSMDANGRTTYEGVGNGDNSGPLNGAMTTEQSNQYYRDLQNQHAQVAAQNGDFDKADIWAHGDPDAESTVNGLRQKAAQPKFRPGSRADAIQASRDNAEMELRAQMGYRNQELDLRRQEVARQQQEHELNTAKFGQTQAEFEFNQRKDRQDRMDKQNAALYPSEAGKPNTGLQQHQDAVLQSMQGHKAADGSPITAANIDSHDETYIRNMEGLKAAGAPGFFASAGAAISGSPYEETGDVNRYLGSPNSYHKGLLFDDYTTAPRTDARGRPIPGTGDKRYINRLAHPEIVNDPVYQGYMNGKRD